MMYIKVKDSFLLHYFVDQDASTSYLFVTAILVMRWQGSNFILNTQVFLESVYTDFEGKCYWLCSTLESK